MSYINICDKCKKKTETQRFHKPYADYLKLNQVNGFCHNCWNEITTEHGTLFDICFSEVVKPYLRDTGKESFNIEYESIWMRSTDIE